MNVLPSFLRRIFTLNALGLAVLVTAHTAIAAESTGASVDPWAQRDAILKRIVPPVFPAKDFLITDYGAVGDGQKDSRAAFAQAIAACTQAGGGRVVVPAGKFYCDGPIHLASNVNLHVSEGATIKFGIAHESYLPVVLTRYEGTVIYGHSPRIYVRGATNVAITGKGLIDGSGRASLDLPRPKGGGAGSIRALADKGVPIEKRIYGEGSWVRPSMIQFYECTNVLVEDVKIIDSTFWIVHPVFCKNVTVRGITVDSMNGNNDGCDPDSSVDVLIENCVFRSGDDSIAIKSGRDLDGRTIARPSENIVIRNITMGSRHSGLCIGSEMSGDVRNVFMEDCKIESVSSAIYFKGNLDRGGTVENVFVRRVHGQRVRDGLVRFDTTYRSQDLRGGNTAPIFRNYLIEDISVVESRTFGLSIEGLDGAPIRDVVIRRATVEKAATSMRIKNIQNVRLEAVKINGELMPESPSDTAAPAAPAPAVKPAM
jgi:polygalacturonase